MLKARTLMLLLLIAGSFGWLYSHGVLNKLSGFRKSREAQHYSIHASYMAKLKDKAEEAREFTVSNNYNSATCFLVDMSLPSGQNRFFVYDLEKDTVKKAGLVAHGNCNQFWLEGRKYDNTPGCGCTSLGKYRIGYHYTGRFGEAFKLYGLEKTNNNAFARAVVLHSYSYVPETEVRTEICQSNGCPMVSRGFLEYLKPILNTSKKPVLLWIYE